MSVVIEEIADGIEFDFRIEIGQREGQRFSPNTLRICSSDVVAEFDGGVDGEDDALGG